MKNHDFKTPSLGTRRGFTLTEVLVVIVIIAIFTTLVFLRTNRVLDMANKANSILNLSQLQIANPATCLASCRRSLVES